MTIFGTSRDLKTKTPKTQTAWVFLQWNKCLGRVHSDAKTDEWVCVDLHYQKIMTS